MFVYLVNVLNCSLYLNVVYHDTFGAGTIVPFSSINCL